MNFLTLSAENELNYCHRMEKCLLKRGKCWNFMGNFGDALEIVHIRNHA
jgi:hypothetical protein